MIFLLELLGALPPFGFFSCFVLFSATIALFILGATTHEDEKDYHENKDLKRAFTLFLITVIVGIVCILAPRPQAVALVWSNQQVEKGKMTREGQKRLLSLYMPVVVEEKK